MFFEMKYWWKWNVFNTRSSDVTLCLCIAQIRKMKLPGRENRIAVVVGTVTDDVRIQDIPKLKVNFQYNNLLDHHLDIFQDCFIFRKSCTNPFISFRSAH